LEHKNLIFTIYHPCTKPCRARYSKGRKENGKEKCGILNYTVNLSPRINKKRLFSKQPLLFDKLVLLLNYSLCGNHIQVADVIYP
jgi:hypothetical protein